MIIKKMVKGIVKGFAGWVKRKKLIHLFIIFLNKYF